MVLLVIVRFKYAVKLQKNCGNFIFLICSTVLFKFLLEKDVAEVISIFQIFNTVQF